MIKEITNEWYNLSQDLTNGKTYNIHIPKQCAIYFFYGTDTEPTSDGKVATLNENSVGSHKQNTGEILWLSSYQPSSKVSILVKEVI